MTSPFGDLIQFASKNRGEGVLIEPRFFYDFLDFSSMNSEAAAYSLTASNSDLASFTNGEQFPVRITHMTLAPELRPATVTGTEILYDIRPSGIQQLLLRIERYGEYYMNEQPIRASVWQNVKTAQPLNLGQGTVTHRFFQPLVLSARDSMRVDFENPYASITTLYTVGSDPSPTPLSGIAGITVQFNGVGMRSGRPYMFASEARDVSGGANSLFVCDAAQLQNLGNEPVALVEMTVTANVASTTNSQPSFLPDVRWLRMQVQQQGNGTQAKWFRGPIYPTPTTRMPLSLFGTDLSAFVTHRFPGDGITLDPGETIRVSGQNSVYGNPTVAANAQALPNKYAVGFAGYLMVT